MLGAPQYDPHLWETLEQAVRRARSTPDQSALTNLYLVVHECSAARPTRGTGAFLFSLLLLSPLFLARSLRPSQFPAILGARATAACAAAAAVFFSHHPNAKTKRHEKRIRSRGHAAQTCAAT